MSRIAALAHTAAMIDLEHAAMRQRTNKEMTGEAMGACVFSIATRFAIAIGGDVSFPKPASIHTGRSIDA